MQGYIRRAAALVFLSIVVVSLAPAQKKKAQAGQLLKPDDWPTLSVPAAGIDVHLRTAWQDDRLKYLVRIDDKEGKFAKYLLKLRSQQPSPYYVFTIVFSDESGFHPYRFLDIPHYLLVQDAGTSVYRYTSDIYFLEKDYRALTSGKITHIFEYPADLGKE